jgi:hypothetical protein
MSSPSNSHWQTDAVLNAFPLNWRKLVTTVVVLTFLSWAGMANAQMNFDTAVDYNVGQGPDGIAYGDFDGDLDEDMAVVTDGVAGNQELIEIFLNNSDGTFTPGAVVLLPNSSSPTEIVAADLDGDLDIDLAVILRDLLQIQIVNNNGGGAFVLGGTTAVGDRARGMTFDDYDFDNDIDLAVANRDDNTATILTNNGAGVFSTTTLAIAGEPRAVTFVDIDGNVDLDFAVTNNDDRNVALFTNTGTGFSPAGTISIGGVHRPEGIVAADLDGNGTQDLAVAVNDNLQPDAAVVFLNVGGTFGVGTPYVTNGQNTSGILAADLDCDGALDLVTRNEDSNDLSLLPNLGGSFGAPMMLTTGLNPSQMVAADFDGDGDPDLAVSNRDSNTFSVLMNLIDCSIAIPVESFTVLRGLQQGGGLAELLDSDDTYLQVRAGLTLGPFEPPVWIEVEATSPTDIPANLTFTLESRGNTGNLKQTVEFFNFDTDSYEEVDMRDATTSDSSIEIQPAGDVTRFVQPGTGLMQARIGWRSQGLIALFPWTISVDQTAWTVTQ